MAAVRVDLWSRAKELLLEQYKSSPNLEGLIRSVIEECAQPVDDQSFDLENFFDLSEAVGGWLDALGSIVHLERNPGEYDSEYRERIAIEASKRYAGTPDSVISESAYISDDPAPQYMDEAPATFFVYTPGGRQLKKKEVQKMAPCGVLGLPGAAIRFADGSVMGDYDGRKILAVADDESRERYVTVNVIAADGRYIVDAAGRRIIAVVKIK